MYVSFDEYSSSECNGTAVQQYCYKSIVIYKINVINARNLENELLISTLLFKY